MNNLSAKDYWENKILKWENSRYSPLKIWNPITWTLRHRLSKTQEWILFNKMNHILELGCGSGRLLEGIDNSITKYTGIDIAENAILVAKEKYQNPLIHFICDDIRWTPLPAADLTVFLGLTDWLNKNELEALFSRLDSPFLLFSFTQPYRWSPYNSYRSINDSQNGHFAKNWSKSFIKDQLKQNNYQHKFIYQSNIINPGSLVWAFK